ncbi:PDR/VanB family oxidoreductase [Nesterenkonia sandarakina]|uniref:Vanillate O-demethylase ferredoxin subunit n=1 Tax=Nesterenkonia sandarakina TaxID=272918 RepID=A0A7Z0J2C4_9MICC|nr:PDR/VanB family oxidoreductase [Nesterenkonia sandarakina]NYJ15694.1 vanillate O-demethylase ferredoxin subunit [Nesterenkonia sandarakina]
MSQGTQLRWQRATVLSHRAAAEEIAEIVLAGEAPLFTEPGAHIDVRVLPGRTDSESVRSYSVVEGAADGSWVKVGVRRSPTSRGGSRFMHALKPGDALEVTAPLQNFPLRVGAPRYVLLAGGVGITAIHAMARVLKRLGTDYQLIFVGRSRPAMAFLEELREEHGPRLRLSVDDEGDVLDVHELLADVDASTEFYMCGPIRLMDAVRRAWIERGLPLPNLRYETFGNSGWFDPEEFELRIRGSERNTVVSSEESILEALERVGVEPMYDCRKGECGLCVVKAQQLNGVIDHRDVFFDEEEKSSDTKLCVCVSRVASRSGAGAEACGADSSAHARPSLTLDFP